MRKIHLVCNAHLDPVWLWRWNEGLAEALSTFRVAADFCEQYDGFVFNHNEALLYEWVEEYEPELFNRIKALVKQGKWKIMGGWYLQPDCNLPSGESFLSQIDLGQKYFKEKFGVCPTTAINFDPFGHTRGLVQILAKKGYKHYVFMRPGEYTADRFRGNFLWQGYDGSTVVAHGIYGAYCTHKGEAAERLRYVTEELTNDDVVLCLWGIGNHGGGPSRIDIEQLNRLAAESKDKMIHSCCEDYFTDVDLTNLKTVKTSLGPSMVGCYSSMVRVKQANRRLENKLAVAEKIMTYAALQSDFKYGFEDMERAKKALAFCQFHDILPGSAIRPAEADGLQTISFGEELVDKQINRAFFKLCEGQKKAEEGSIPVLVFNPHPYEVNTELEVGFMLQNQNRNADEVTLVTIYDEQGNRLPTQNEKPDCTFNLDWIEKISFTGRLAPASVTRFDCKMKVHKKAELPKIDSFGERIAVNNDRMSFILNRKSGLIEEYKVDGNIIVKNSGLLEAYSDNEDPWGMTVTAFNTLAAPFTLMSDAEANEFTGYPEETTPNVRVVENGEVRIRLQSFWRYRSTRAMVEYTIPKKGAYVDISFVVYSGEPNITIKYRLDTAFSGTPYGQQAFGFDEMRSDKTECVFQKWCGIKGDKASLCLLNDGTYAGSFSPNAVYLTLLRTPVYSAHPIGKLPIAPHDRFLDHIDMGERRFSFRLTDFSNPDVEGQLFNEKPICLSFFPSGRGDKKQTAATLDNGAVLLSSIRIINGGYEATLYNTDVAPQTATLSLPTLNKGATVELKGMEFKIITL